MHRQNASLRHRVVHVREHGFLHFPGIFSAENDDFAILQRQINAGPGGHAAGVAVGGESTRVVDHQVGIAEGLQSFVRGADQHVVHKQCVIRSRADHANLQSSVWIPTSVAVHHVEVAASVKVIDGTFTIT